MKTSFALGEMIQYLPASLKDAIHHASQETGQDADKLELHRVAHSEKAQVNQLDPKVRKSLKYVSARTQDRDDEIVVPGGIQLKDFMRYGSVLVNHNYSLMPIGSDEWIVADDYGIKALTNHADTGEGTLANVVWHLVSQGHMKASSIGFVPVETTKPGRRDWDTVANKLQREWPEFTKEAAEKSLSRIITKGVLLEHSFVSVPCNVDAEVEQIIKGMGIKDEAVFKGLGWKTEEKDGVLIPKREMIMIKTVEDETTEKGVVEVEPKEGFRQFKKVEEKGGPGSGHFGHAGRPGEVGGSGDNNGDVIPEGIGGSRDVEMSLTQFTGKIPSVAIARARVNIAKETEKIENRNFKNAIANYKKNPTQTADRLVMEAEAKFDAAREILSRLEGNLETANMLAREEEGIVEEKGEKEKQADDTDAETKSLDITCSRKLASLRKRAGEEMTAELDVLEAEMEGLAEDDTKGWKALNGKLNEALTKLKVEVKEDEEETPPIKEKKSSHELERIIKVVQPPPFIKVLFAPLNPQEVVRVAGAAAEKAISRRLGRLG